MKKLHSQAGFSLTEVLVALAILGLLTLAITAGISSSVPVYRESMDLSESAVLSSTLSQALFDELRFAENVEVDASGLLTFTSRSYGPDVSISTSDEGYLQVGSSLLVGDGAYTGMSAQAGITYDAAEQSFTVLLSIFKDGAEKKQVPFTVRSVNADSYTSSGEQSQTEEEKHATRLSRDMQSLIKEMQNTENIKDFYQKYGINSTSNDNLRKALYYKVYGETWPTFTKAFKEANGLNVNQEYYIQPFITEIGEDRYNPDEVVIFARTAPGTNGGWYTNLYYIYDSQTGIGNWYRCSYSFSFNSKYYTLSKLKELIASEPEKWTQLIS